MWQIGVDVVPSERGRGVGAAIVGRLTHEVLQMRLVPFYAAVSNIRSRYLATSLGYWLAWVQVYAKGRSED